MIFCDMDGVLVDFDGAFLKKHGVLPYKIPREELWEIVITTPNYWVNLPKMPDADILINYLQKTGFKILTGLPVYGFDKAEKEKKQSTIEKERQARNQINAAAYLRKISFEQYGRDFNDPNSMPR